MPLTTEKILLQLAERRGLRGRFRGQLASITSRFEQYYHKIKVKLHNSTVVTEVQFEKVGRDAERGRD